MSYNEILEREIVMAKQSGFDVNESEINPKLFDFQKYCVVKMLKNDRRAIGCELKDSYFETACKNIRNAENAKLQLSLFDEYTDLGVCATE